MAENNLIPKENDGEALGSMLNAILSPVMETIAALLKNNTEAVQALAAQQKIQSDHLAALEQQIRLNTLVTPAQVKYIGAAIQKRSRELLAKKGLENDKKCVNAISKAIRKGVLARLGAAAVHDIPKHEYPVVMQQIGTWNDMLMIMDVSREGKARKAAENPNGIDKDFSGLTEDDCHV